MKKTLFLCLVLLVCDAIGVFKHEHSSNKHQHNSCETHQQYSIN